MRIALISPLLIAALWAQSTPPPPRLYKIATMENFGPSRLNQRGETFGYAQDPQDSAYVLIRWTPSVPNGATGSQRQLRNAVSADARGAVENDLGQVFYTTINDKNWLTGIWIWTPDSTGSTTGQAVRILGLWEFNSGVIAVNGYGQVLTYTYGNQIALWTPASRNGTTGALAEVVNHARPISMNDFGQILSHHDQTAFRVFRPTQANQGTGTNVDIPMPPGSQSIEARIMNNRGDVAGERCVIVPGSECQTRGFIWRPTVPNGTSGTFTDIAPPTGYTGLSISGLNELGDAVGVLIRGPGAASPFIYTGGAAYEIPMSGQYGTIPNAKINDFGQILVQSVYGPAVLLTPYTMPNAAPNSVSVTISTSTPFNIPFTVTGEGCQAGDYPTPQVLRWTPGATCTIDWNSPQTFGLTRRVSFAGWADGAAGEPRTITAPATSTTYQANFQTEGVVTFRISPTGAGTISGPKWAKIGEVLTFTATPNPGFQFLNWHPSNRTDPTITLTFTQYENGQSTGDARFARVGTAPPNYGITTFTGIPAAKGALNNYGQILSWNPSPSKLWLWTPGQPNATTGTATSLSSITPAGYNLGIAAINDHGTVVADTGSGTPLRMWKPSTPNAKTGTYNTIDASPSFVLRGMNNYGQLFGRFYGVPGVWTPSVANGITGTVRTDARFGTIDAWGPSGQTVSANSADFNLMEVFTPTGPHTVTGGFNSTELVHYSDTRLGRFGPGGELLFANRCKEFGCDWRPRLWRPVQAHTLAGSVEDLPFLEGFWDFQPIFMNARGEVLGTMYADNRHWVPFLISNGKMYDVGALPGVPASVTPAGLNDAGQILLGLSTNVTQMFLLTPLQPAVCMVHTVPYRLTVGPAAGRSQAALQVDSACAWSATSDSSWLRVVNASGQGKGALQIDVATNDTGSLREGVVTVNGFELHVSQTSLPLVSFRPQVLNFRRSGALVSEPQTLTFRLNGTGTVNWSDPGPYNPLSATACCGDIPGSMTYSLRPGASQRSTASGAFSLHVNGASQDYISIPYVIEDVPFTAAPSPPYGSFDTPLNDATNLSGGVAVTGWALDDYEVERVEIWRDRLGNEPVHPNGKVYIGIATFVLDARPDIEARYPGVPLNRRAGWGYMLLSNALPNPKGQTGNGVYTIEAIATDRQGNSASLGRRTITVNNVDSKKPFGAIDTPGPGATVSGTGYVSSGWVLTPKPSIVPPDGHTVMLYIDGVPQRTVAYNQLRNDVAGLFPNYLNASGAGATVAFDTTTLSNGMHTIYWVAIDDQGNADGIGSRYFNTMNEGASGTSEPAPPRRDAAAAFDGDRLRAESLGLVEFQLPGAGTDMDWAGALVIRDEKRPLPVGSTLDHHRGRFYWHPAPGFLGDYELEFTNRATGATHRVTVQVGQPESRREER